MLIAALALAAAASATPAPDMLAPAWAGQVQCFMPDEAKKGCASIAIYRKGAGGEIVNEAIVALSKSPDLTMTTVAPVYMKDGSLCGRTSAEDLQKATFTINGQAANAQQTAMLRTEAAKALAAFVGKEVCTRWGVGPGVTQAGAVMEGQTLPGMPVLWVAPEAGYAVRIP